MQLAFSFAVGQAVDYILLDVHLEECFRDYRLCQNVTARSSRVTVRSSRVYRLRRIPIGLINLSFADGNGYRPFLRMERMYCS